MTPRDERDTLSGCLRRAAAVGHPGRDGLRFLDLQERATWLDWSLVHDRARCAAGRLRALGVKPGDRVAVVTTTSPLFMDALFGTLLAGATPVPLYPPVRLGRMGEYVEKTAAMLEGKPATHSTSGEDVAEAVAFLAGQSSRGWTHELTITPAGDRWVP